VETESGDWISLESYIESNSEARFTHGICPDCLGKLQLGKTHTHE
jgi:hypothetical protein